ncbi:hypothetical protein [Pseudomonas sp. Irchel 3E19]|uniref:hypothetical protein n=1 Tax=Pseudomonas sp. Irchel 3E19 TaxID=2008981 RepID=UPI0014839D74|nr:hypothetical protein [Pseudomonas sp. Irchel 3E19]
MTSKQGASAFAPGELDPTFGVDGVVQIPNGSGSLRCMIEDEQGSIVHGLWVSNEIWLYRILADGSADLQFGEEGVTKWGFAPGSLSVPVQLLLQADGKYVLIGSLRNSLSDEQSRVAVTRFNSNGTPDLVFGNKILPLPAEGNVFTEFPSHGCLQGDGKILVAAPYTLVDQQQIVYRGTRLHRLLANGESDLEFGGGRGFIEVRLNGQDTTIASVVIARDGKILVGGTLDRIRDGVSDRKQSIARFTPMGALDQAFGCHGYWEEEGYNSTGRIILDDQERIIVVGTESAENGNYYVCISRLTVDGEFDKAFNSGSRLSVDIPVDFPGYYVTCSSVALQASGKIIAAGHAGANTQSYWLRVQTSGVLDPGFGVQGVRVYEPSKLMGGVLVQRNTQRIVAGIDSATHPIPEILGILS